MSLDAPERQEVAVVPQLHDGIVAEIEKGLTGNGADLATAIAVGSLLGVFSERQKVAPLSLQAAADQAGRIKAERDLENAHIDRVTGLKTDKSFWQDIKSYADRMVGENSERRSVFMFVLDLEGLKRTNDTCGRIEGDRYLRETAHTVDDETRKNDEWYRLGGGADEIVGILHSIRPDKDGSYDQVLEKKCQELAKKVRERLIEVGLPVEELHLGIKIVGGQLMPGQKPEDLFNELDAQIRAMKNEGRKKLPKHLAYDRRLDTGPNI
ncbi:MAG: GGDEF domain-containing protein [Candidatus Saccharibacteria bacterium]|nr:GGDEF domain-containing protein [Candidatus Saccharibacteria bacterium]